MPTSKKTPCIFIVDDDEGILDSFSALLGDSGYDIQTSLGDESLLPSIRKGKPQLIILDVLLSGKDGRDICRKLKTDSEMKDIPVIMTSARPDIEKSVRDSGADDYLYKPFETDAFLTMVAKHIKRP